MKKILALLFNLLFGKYGVYIKCILYNFKQNDFKIHFKDNIYKVSIDNIEMKFYENPYYLLVEQKQYFKFSHIKKGDTIIDAGAFMGTFTVYASLITENGKVIVFEPDPDNYKMVEKHIELNNLNNVILLKKGLWDCEKTLKFEQNNVGSTLNIINEDNPNLIEVQVCALDEILNDHKIGNIDFIKMDIEGAEIEALMGANKTLVNNDVKLAIASYHIVKGKETYISVEKQLSNMGYQTNTVIDPERVTHAWK